MNSRGTHPNTRADNGIAADVVVGGRYRLVSLLGEGGIAVVWRARDMRSGVHHAVKLLAPGRGGWSRRGTRLLREARVMTRLRHEHIVSVHDVGDGPLGPWFSMDLVPGGTVDARIRREGHVAPAQAITWAIDGLRGLAAAHDHGVIHRDIKPSNLLLDANGRVVVADFGIALVDDAVSRDTRTGATLGSMLYMAPEQRLDARNVGPEADIYAMAAMLYHAISGGTPMDLFLATPDSPRWLDLPPSLVPAMQRAVRTDPEQRYRSAAVFADDLQAVLAALPAADDAWERPQNSPRNRSGTVSMDAFRDSDLSAAGATLPTLMTDDSADDEPSAPEPSLEPTSLSEETDAPHRVLVVDDDPIHRRLLSRWLELAGYAVTVAANGSEGIRTAARLQPHLVLLDLYMDGIDGFGVIEALKAMHRAPRVIVMTADDGVHTVVRAMRAGAADYMTKPLKQSETLARLRGVLEEGRLLAPVEEPPEVFEGMIARSGTVRSIFRTVEQTARRSGSVLVAGPAGSGKSQVALALHARSPRRNAPLVTVSCAALRPDDAARTLGGQLPSGKPRRGMSAFERAFGGTLVLDDVDRLPADVQPLLAARLVGHGRPRRDDETEAEADVRVIATTRRDLGELVRKGRFDPTLFERLAGLEVQLPALVDRHGDLPLLTERLGRELAGAVGREMPRFTPAASEVWSAHDWPGNIQELRDALTYVLAAEVDEITLDHLPPSLQLAAIDAIEPDELQAL